MTRIGRHRTIPVDKQSKNRKFHAQKNAISMSQPNEYLLGASLSEGDRLLGQAKRIEAYSRWLLNQIDLQPGSADVDLGCGPLGILNLLAEQVGTNGRVVEVDQSQLMLDLAQRSVTALGLTNMQFTARGCLVINVHCPEFLCGLFSAFRLWCLATAFAFLSRHLFFSLLS